MATDNSSIVRPHFYSIYIRQFYTIGVYDWLFEHINCIVKSNISLGTFAAVKSIIFIKRLLLSFALISIFPTLFFRSWFVFFPLLLIQYYICIIYKSLLLLVSWMSCVLAFADVYVFEDFIFLGQNDLIFLGFLLLKLIYVLIQFYLSEICSTPF